MTTRGERLSPAPLLGFCILSISFALERVAVVTIATDDYYAKGALVTLHSAGVHAGVAVDQILLVPPGAGLSKLWTGRFGSLGIKIVKVPEVRPSEHVLAAMQKDREQLAGQNLLEVLQPVPYGGAFAKIHAWSPELVGDYDRVLLLDGDILVKRDLRPLLALAPLAAARDLRDAFNYGVVVLQPNAEIHRQLRDLLQNASEAELALYNTRKEREVGFCDQTLVAGFLARNHGPVSFFEDLKKASRKDPKNWLLSTDFNLVVSYRAQDRCEVTNERKRVKAARIVHFANNWINFDALARNRSAPGRIDSPRCYQAAFHYWHDVYHHAVNLADTRVRTALPEPPAMTDGPGLAAPQEVQEVFLDFQRIRARATTNSQGEL